MKKVLKYIGIAISIILALALLVIAFVAIYPEISKIRKACNQVEIGMDRVQVESILNEVLARDPDMQSADEGHVFVMKNGIDCSVKFDSDGLVGSVRSAQDGF